MEKFAVDLDKLLDDLENDAAPHVQHVAQTAEAADAVETKFASRPATAAAGSSSAADLIDLSDADFGPACVQKPSAFAARPYGGILAATGAISPLPSFTSDGYGASAARRQAEPARTAFKMSSDSFGSYGLEGTSNGVVINGHSNGSDNGSSYVNMHIGSAPSDLRATVPNDGSAGDGSQLRLVSSSPVQPWLPAAAVPQGDGSGRPADGRQASGLPRADSGSSGSSSGPKHFNPLDSEPHFACSESSMTLSSPTTGVSSMISGRPGGMGRLQFPDVLDGGSWQSPIPVAAKGSFVGATADFASTLHPVPNVVGRKSETIDSLGERDEMATGRSHTNVRPVDSGLSGSSSSSSNGNEKERASDGSEESGRIAPVARDEANSLLTANGIVRRTSPPPLQQLLPPATVAGSTNVTGTVAHEPPAMATTSASGSAAASAQSSLRHSLEPRSATAAVDRASDRLDSGCPGTAALRFDDIRVEEYSDDEDEALMDAYLQAGMTSRSVVQQQQQQYQPPVQPLSRNALLEANLVLLPESQSNRLPSEAATVAVDERSLDDDYVALPAPQENALLLANLVDGVVAPPAARYDGQRALGVLPSQSTLGLGNAAGAADLYLGSAAAAAAASELVGIARPMQPPTAALWHSGEGGGSRLPQAAAERSATAVTAQTTLSLLPPNYGGSSSGDSAVQQAAVPAAVGEPLLLLLRDTPGQPPRSQPLSGRAENYPVNTTVPVVLAAQPEASAAPARCIAPDGELPAYPGTFASAGGSPSAAISNQQFAGSVVLSSGAARECRRPTSLLGLSKVALDGAGFASAAAPCNRPSADGWLPTSPGQQDLGTCESRPKLAATATTAEAAGSAELPASAVAPAIIRADGESRQPETLDVSRSTEIGEATTVAAAAIVTGEPPVGADAVIPPGEPTAAAALVAAELTNGADYGEAAGRGASLQQAAGGDATADGAAVDWDDLGATKPLWMPDSEALQCMACAAKFTFTKRRHHCRACGLVFCATCCNMKSRLQYMDFKEARVCLKCHDQLAVGELRQRELLHQRSGASIPDALAAEQAQPGSAASHERQEPDDDAASAANCGAAAASSDITGAAAAGGAAAASHPAPPGVLRRSRSRNGQSKTVMFSDGIRPGGDLTHLDGSVPDPSAAGGGRFSSQSGQGHGTTRSKRKRTSVGDLIKPRTAFIIPKTGLPPVLFFTDSHSREYVIDENPDSSLLYDAMKDQSGETSFAFVIHKDLHIYVKLVQLDCCAKKLCWCFTSKGLCTVGQEEVVVVIECNQNEKDIPTDMFYFYRVLYEQTFKGIGATELGFMACNKETLRKPSDGFLGSSTDHAGFLFVRPTFQCLQGLPLPPSPYLVALLLDRMEEPWARVFPLRLALRLGAEYRYYPCPIVSIRGRKPVYGDVGHTIMNLLADFRGYQYTLGRVEGLTVHLQDKVTVISFPKNKYNEICKILNSSNDYVLALGASFSTDADSHLVCVQTDEGVYQTQAINIQDKPRKVTGASFVVFSGALKTSTPGVIAKSSIVEDGLMVQILPEAMLDLKNSIKNMQDHSIKCGGTHLQQQQQQQGSPSGNIEEAVHIKWVDEYKRYNVGVTSPIDGFPLDGVESVHVYGYAELAGSGRRSIRWTEVFFLQSDESGSGTAAEHLPADLGRLAETIAGSCMAAASPHLEALRESGSVKIGLRVTLGADQVGYEIGSNGCKLPSHIVNDLDNELVPVIHSTASSLSSGGGGLTVLELVFHVLE